MAIPTLALQRVLKSVVGMAIVSIFLSASAAGTDPDPRFTAEMQTRALIDLWQSTCLKYYRNPLALGTFLLKAGYLKDPPNASSFLKGEAGTVWDVSANVFSQRVLTLLDNGVCEVRAQTASAPMLRQALIDATSSLRNSGAIVTQTINEDTDDLGHQAFRYMYTVTHRDDRSSWVFGGSGSDNPLTNTRAVLLISRSGVRPTNQGAATGTALATATTQTSSTPAPVVTTVPSVHEEDKAKISAILQDLKRTTTPQFASQIETAVDASDMIQADIAELASDQRFLGFSVTPKAQFKSPFRSLFNGLVHDKRIVFTPELLTELKKDRLFDVVYPDDIPPSNTVFAIAHLLYHVRHPITPNDYSNPRDFSAAVLKIEAGAFIHAWNASIQVAQRKNNGKTLTPMQIGQLLMNLRYRFAFIGAMEKKDNSLVFGPTGEMEYSEINLRAIMTPLGKSSIPDLQ